MYKGREVAWVSVHNEPRWIYISSAAETFQEVVYTLPPVGSYNYKGDIYVYNTKFIRYNFDTDSYWYCSEGGEYLNQLQSFTLGGEQPPEYLANPPVPQTSPTRSRKSRKRKPRDSFGESASKRRLEETSSGEDTDEEVEEDVQEEQPQVQDSSESTVFWTSTIGVLVPADQQETAASSSLAIQSPQNSSELVIGPLGNIPRRDNPPHFTEMNQTQVESLIQKAVGNVQALWQHDKSALEAEIVALKGTHTGGTGGTSRPSELRIAQPAAFNGDRRKARTFLNDAQAYLDTNFEVYNNDLKKIMFVLSFMKDGTAGAWKDNFIGEKNEQRKTNKLTAGNALSYGNWEDFVAAFDKAFFSTDIVADARYTLENLTQGKRLLEEYISKFTTLARQAELKDESTLMDYFLRGLRKELAEKVLGAENQPTKLDATLDLARKFDKHMQRAQRILQGLKGHTNGSSSDNKTTAVKDPWAMVVDRLSTEDKERFMKEGRCFNCGLRGHNSRTCPRPKQNQGSTNKPSNFQNKPRTPETKSNSPNQPFRRPNYNKIRAILPLLTEEHDHEVISMVINQLESMDFDGDEGKQMEQDEQEVDDVPEASEGDF